MSFPFTAALLVGGKSSRMGEDKAFLLWDGQPLWRRQLQVLKQLSPAGLLVAARKEQLINAQDFQVLHDLADESGPLPAVVRCLAVAQQPMLVLGVDLPLMTSEVLRFVMDHASAEQGFVFERDGFFEPMAALYPPAMLPHLEAARSHGRLQQALQNGVAVGAMTSAMLPSAFEHAFVNANTPEEWKSAQQSR